MRLERSAGQTRLIAEFELSTDAHDAIVDIEATHDLANAQWTRLEDGVGNTIIASSGSKLSVSIPADQGRQFLRLTVSLK